MGQIFKKSINDLFRKYFESQQNIEKHFRKYSLKEKKIISSKSINNPIYPNGAGVPLYWDKENGFVFHDHSDSHTLVIGPTGSKKTRLIAMPSVLLLGKAKESMIIADPKAEIYARTSGFLTEEGYNVQIINLRSPSFGAGWNPLELPYRFFSEGDIDRSYEFVNDIAQNLMNDVAANDPFWTNSASSLFFGLCILLFKYSKDFDLPRETVHIGNILALRSKLLTGAQNEIRRNPLWLYAKQDDFIYSSLVGTVETANDTRAGIVSVFDEKMRCFATQPNLLEMLHENQVSFDGIGNTPTAVFIIMPDEKTSYHKLVSLFVKQSYEFLIYQTHNNQKSEYDGLSLSTFPVRVNYILDEFSALPTIKDFPSMITAARSRNIRFCLIVQSKHQLVQRYAEETDTIQSNCSNWIFLTSRELNFLEEFSKLCGDANNQKPLLSISELQRLNKEEGESVILSGRLKPIVACLPDIEQYDNSKWVSISIAKRPTKDITTCDFKLPEDVLKALIPRQISEFQLDTMISAIDEKIKALEAEEQQKAKDNSSHIEEGESNENEL